MLIGPKSGQITVEFLNTPSEPHFFSGSCIMKKWIVCLTLSLGLLWAAPSVAQEAVKPGPEHAVLKKIVGNWDAEMDMGPAGKSKGSMTTKEGPGGTWF